MSNDTINRCQPGYNASCSLCCGSHNYTKPKNLIEEMFSKRAEDYIIGNAVYQEEAYYPKLFEEEMQCQNLGEMPGDPGLIGCLTYCDHDLKPDTKYFFDGTCKKFLCDAWHDLTDRQVLFAAELMEDWYYYSLLIKDIELVYELCATYNSPSDVPTEELDLLKEDLLERFLEEGGNF